MSGLELLKLMGPLAGTVAKPLSDKIQNKLNPNELEKGASQFCKRMKRNQYYSRASIANNAGLYISTTIGENK